MSPELNMALALRKPAIVMAAPSFLQSLLPAFSSNLVVLDPANPEAAEVAIVQHLRTVNAEQDAKKALLALGTIALACSYWLRRIELLLDAGEPLHDRHFVCHRARGP